MEDTSEQMLLEILRMARELVINEHTDRRAQLHNNWLYESEQLWKTRRMKLKYPDIPPYPTEQDVLERAQTLLKFLVLGNNKVQSETPVELPVAFPQETKQEPIVEETNLLVTEEKIIPPEELVAEEKVETSGRILPAVLKKIEQMRSKF